MTVSGTTARLNELHNGLISSPKGLLIICDREKRVITLWNKQCVELEAFDLCERMTMAMTLTTAVSTPVRSIRRI